MPKNELLISGYYGFGNIGDEAVLAGILTGLRQVAPEVTPVVLTSSPDETAAVHQVQVVHREHMNEVWQAMGHGSALLSGGGSLLQDVTSRRSIYYYLGVMVMARLKRLPFCIYGQGIGPLVTAAARRATRFLLRRSRGIWVRDAASQQLLQSLLGNYPKTTVTGDAAFLLSPPDAATGRCQLHAAIEKAGITTEGPVWVVAVRPWDIIPGWQSALETALVQAAGAAGATLAFLSMHASLDTGCAEHMVTTMCERAVPACVISLKDSDDRNLVNTASAILAGADMVIAMRLHALLLAAAAGVPGVAVSYDPKVTALAQELHLPWVPLEQLAKNDSHGALTQCITSAWHDRIALATGVQAKAAEWRMQALTGLREAVAALGLPVFVSPRQHEGV